MVIPKEIRDRAAMPPPALTASALSNKSLSQSSQDSGKFSYTIGLKVKELCNNVCWICGVKMAVQVAHVIAKEDQQVSVWLEKSLFNFGLTSLHNAILLCCNCHRAFDRRIDPGVIIILSELQYFIDFEVEDRKARFQAQKYGALIARTVPTKEDYRDHQVQKGVIPEGTNSGLFRAIFLWEDFPTTDRADLEIFQQPKIWHGAPIATIRAALRDLYSDAEWVLDDLEGFKTNIPKRDRVEDEDINDSRPPKTLKTPRKRNSTTGGSQRKLRKRNTTTGGRGSTSTQPTHCSNAVQETWNMGPNVTTEEIVRRWAPLIEVDD
ncbi:hypothetical protein N7495_000258 [Penicillium taxi]|uniref:uncharacterized protein n=1 Tax=Penicillium taxi TaxID=168475 RepID=UPI0025456742|nr:uncharacterized protein N7495_000258 [Penicillium taxi]KAJ5907576.1 hypothetical protein N7495_000258 [Penicillium taxi]